MILVKGVLNFFSPGALSIQETFSKDPIFQQLMNEIDPLTGQKYTTQSATQKFLIEQPKRVFDLTTGSNSPYEPFPETVSAMNMIKEHREWVTKYPFATSFLIDRNSAYDPSAYTLETSLGLRSADTPQQFLDAILISAGDDYYYNYIVPQSGTDYTAAAAAAKTYGRMENPTWYAQFSGQLRQNHKVQAIDQMIKLLDEPHVPSGLLSHEDRVAYRSLLDVYLEKVRVVKQFLAAGDKADANAIKSSYYAQMTATPSSEWQKYSYFMAHVLAGMPTA
jgi:hypothetical protein